MNVSGEHESKIKALRGHVMAAMADDRRYSIEEAAAAVEAALDDWENGRRAEAQDLNKSTSPSLRDGEVQSIYSRRRILSVSILPHQLALKSALSLTGS